MHSNEETMTSLIKTKSIITAFYIQNKNDAIFCGTNGQIDPKIRVEVSQRVDYACF